MLQAADFIAHAIWLLYERRDHALVRPLLGHFDVHEGVIHDFPQRGHSLQKVIGVNRNHRSESRRNQ